MTEGRLGELHHAGPGLVEELGGAAQQSLSLRERLGQLLLPLHELGVALHGHTKGQVATSGNDNAARRPAQLWPPVGAGPGGRALQGTLCAPPGEALPTIRSEIASDF